MLDFFVPKNSCFLVKKLNGKDDTICVTFANEKDKDKFFNNYIKVASKMTVGNLFNFPGNKKRIFIQNDFSKKQYAIFKEAMILKKEKKIKSLKLVPNGFNITFYNGSKSTISSVENLHCELIVN